MELGVGSNVLLTNSEASTTFGLDRGTPGVVIYQYRNTGNLRVSFNVGTENQPVFLRETVRPADVELAED